MLLKILSVTGCSILFFNQFPLRKSVLQESRPLASLGFHLLASSFHSEGSQYGPRIMFCWHGWEKILCAIRRWEILLKAAAYSFTILLPFWSFSDFRVAIFSTLKNIYTLTHFFQPSILFSPFGQSQKTLLTKVESHNTHMPYSFSFSTFDSWR